MCRCHVVDDQRSLFGLAFFAFFAEHFFGVNKLAFNLNGKVKVWACGLGATVAAQTNDLTLLDTL